MDQRQLVSASLAIVSAVMFAHVSFSQATAAQSASAANAEAALTAFEVVLVKPVAPGTVTFQVPMNGTTVRMGFLHTPDGVHWGGITVSTLIRDAYGGFLKLPNEDSVTGLPHWAKTETFEVQGKMSEAQAAAFAKLGKDEQQEQREVMLRALLADRFKLKVHREPKQVPEYDLVIAKGGLKIKESYTNPDGIMDKNKRSLPGTYIALRRPGELVAQGCGIEQFANVLGQSEMGVGRMVKDKTGLTGKYSFTLNWTPDHPQLSGGMVPPESGDDSGPSIFTAVEGQLGLKLQPGTEIIDTVVVDRLERPTQN